MINKCIENIIYILFKKTINKTFDIIIFINFLQIYHVHNTQDLYIQGDDKWKDYKRFGSKWKYRKIKIFYKKFSKKKKKIFIYNN